ncbi:hypothetical protein MiSe_60710 [Microseira wollei NIES-4236]|uniref:Uncharacterized protein n=1 Tax=Microseira wollei NIES-4236 TaxID=2530354 RepID=A0AAV3WKR0_9CYAN|nr:hypothetical protein MiSe_60710 [Microseira wollei NIES-4236]
MGYRSGSDCLQFDQLPITYNLLQAFMVENL